MLPIITKALPIFEFSVDNFGFANLISYAIDFAMNTTRDLILRIISGLGRGILRYNAAGSSYKTRRTFKKSSMLSLLDPL